MSAWFLHDLDWHLGAYTFAVVFAIWAHARERSDGAGLFFFALALLVVVAGVVVR